MTNRSARAICASRSFQTSFTYRPVCRKFLAKMIFFINALRALAACLITNSHYTDVYPLSIIANGGMLGNIIFFAVSGYCLYNVRLAFPKWYFKRLYRIYPAVWIVTGIYFLLGSYDFTEHSARWWIIYPTFYHFIASIVALYIPFYIFMRFPVFRNRLVPGGGGIAVAWLLIYFTVYDRSYYHIDNVRQPMVRFLFMECMLLGAWFRQNDAKFRNVFKFRYAVASVLLFFIYFASKIALSRYEFLAEYQIFNHFIIFALLVVLFRTFMGLDSKLERLPKPVKCAIVLVSTLTLEIYVVQYRALIDFLAPIGRFPLNWFATSSAILLCAYILHKICGVISRGCDKLVLTKKE